MLYPTFIFNDVFDIEMNTMSTHEYSVLPIRVHVTYCQHTNLITNLK